MASAVQRLQEQLKDESLSFEQRMRVEELIFKYKMKAKHKRPNSRGKKNYQTKRSVFEAQDGQ